MTSATPSTNLRIIIDDSRQGNNVKLVGHRASGEHGFFIKYAQADGMCMRDNLKRYCEMALKFGSERFALICEQYNPHGRNNERKFSHMSLVRFPKMTNEDYGRFYIEHDDAFVMEKIKEIDYIDVSNGRMQMVKYNARFTDMLDNTDNYEHIFIRLAEDNMKALLEYAEKDLDYLYTIGSSIFTVARSIWKGQKIESHQNDSIVQLRENVFDNEGNFNTEHIESVNMYGIYIENLHYKFKMHKQGKGQHPDITIAPDIDWCDIFKGRSMVIKFDSKDYMDKKSQALIQDLAATYGDYEAIAAGSPARKWILGLSGAREGSDGQLSSLIRASQTNTEAHRYNTEQQRKHSWRGRCFRKYAERVNDRNWLPFGVLLRDVIKHTGSLSFLKAE